MAVSLRSWKYWGLILAVAVLASVQPVAAETPFGRLSGLVVDEGGRPLSDVFVSLLGRSDDALLPILARTDDSGRILIDGLAAGTYRLAVKSVDYRAPVSRLVEIAPDHTSVVTLILQQMFSLGADSENVGLKALFRTSQSRRLIFRETPGQLPDDNRSPSPVEEAVVQVYGSGGPGSDYVVVPGDVAGGATTSFAAVLPSLGQTRQIVAGQLNSGEDSLWRIKNIIGYQLADNHRLNLFLGYGRVSFEQPSIALMNDPNVTPEHGQFAALSGTSRLLNVGFEDNLVFGPALTLTWGFEVDQVRGEGRDSFVSPSAAIEYSPLNKTRVRLEMTSKRSTAANTVLLPEGERVSVGTPLNIARYNGDTLFGVGRHYVGSVTQEVTSDTEVEFAVFRNQAFSPAVPVVAILEPTHETEALPLGSGQADTRGCRVSLRKGFGDLLKAELSYVQGRAPGVFGPAGALDSFPKFVQAGTFHGLMTKWEAYIPVTGTHLTALLKFVPNADPLVTIDSYADVYDTGNEGVNLFVRQVVPLPEEVLKFFGLDFLSLQRVEALLDVRNLMNDDLGTLETPSGPVTLLHNVRSIRGGVSFKF